MDIPARLVRRFFYEALNDKEATLLLDAVLGHEKAEHLADAIIREQVSLRPSGRFDLAYMTEKHRSNQKSLDQLSELLKLCQEVVQQHKLNLEETFTIQKTNDGMVPVVQSE